MNKLAILFLTLFLVSLPMYMNAEVSKEKETTPDTWPEPFRKKTAE